MKMYIISEAQTFANRFCVRSASRRKDTISLFVLFVLQFICLSSIILNNKFHNYTPTQK